MRTERLNQFSAAGPSISCALTVAKSVAKFGGSFRGQETSPALRALSGGTDTVISAKFGVSTRSPLNISPGLSARPRVVATSIAT
ncbi:hypothetical protein [Rhizobium mongolense]|uniref:Uncharacterized protein n=1 Tax=Rhizobium mongolense TaxID=57676 RepID=A0ABR6IF41_9HYPH|nr:hypothetical protein [Rhizobium mongolense]